MAAGAGDAGARAGGFGPADAVQLVATLAAAPLLAAALLVRPAWRRDFGGRLGLGWPVAGPRPRLWAHGASVGEIEALIPFIECWRTAYPEGSVVVTASTHTGRDAAARAFGSVAVWAGLLPLDVAGIVDRAVRRVEPDLFVFSENELWPQMLRALARAGVPAVQLSGRVSAATARMLTWCHPLRRRVVGAVELHCVQSAADRARLLSLGVDPTRVVAAGSLKGERRGGAAGGVLAAALRDERRPIVVAGSTHAGEETLVLEALTAGRERGLDVLWIVAPRHPERFAEVRRLVAASGESWLARSALDSNPQQGAALANCSVLVLDSLGELAGLYASATLAILGGTFVPIGGHNPLEPAAAGAPVVVGIHHERIREVVDDLRRAGAGFVAQRASDIVGTLEQVLPVARHEEISEAARRVAARAGGTLERTWEALDTRGLLPPRGNPEPA